MALLPLCRTPAGMLRLRGRHLFLYFVLLGLILYFLHWRRWAALSRPTVAVGGVSKAKVAAPPKEVRLAQATPALQTPWGAPLVWGDSANSERYRAQMGKRDVRTGLLMLVVGTYARYVRGFLWSAEQHFLSGHGVTYYVLTDNPRCLDPPVELRPGRKLQVVPVTELPGWERLTQRRMAVIAEALGDGVGRDVDYLFCADVDQEFLAPVGEEILGELVATLHPELFGMPRSAFPYEEDESSSAYVGEDEGDYYYTSELYGGLVAQVLDLARACTVLILQDQANDVMAHGLEESYLNRYLLDHRPTRVLSPEYSWWDSALAVDVPTQRLISLGRQCEALDEPRRRERHC